MTPRAQLSKVASIAQAYSTKEKQRVSGINQPIGSSYIRSKQMNFDNNKAHGLASKKVQNLQKQQQENLKQLQDKLNEVKI
jgi:hypothetical protein